MSQLSHFSRGQVAKCSFSKYGSSGTVERYDGLCILSLNIFNEKVLASSQSSVTHCKNEWPPITTMTMVVLTADADVKDQLYGYLISRIIKLLLSQIYILLWFWFVFLTVVSGLNLVWRVSVLSKQ